MSKISIRKIIVSLKNAFSIHNFAAGASQVKKTQVKCASCMGGYCGIKLNSIASRVRSNIQGLEKLRKMPGKDGIDCVACMTTTDTKSGQS